MAQFDHERLEVYQAGIAFLAIVQGVVEHFPKGRAYLIDQLERAALSIPLNIAEGAGEFAKKEKARFYRFALRSATECAAILDACRCLRLVEEARCDEGRDLLLRIVGMLTRLVRNLLEGKGWHGGRVAASKEAGTGTGGGTGTG